MAFALRGVLCTPQPAWKFRQRYASAIILPFEPVMLVPLTVDLMAELAPAGVHASELDGFRHLTAEAEDAFAELSTSGRVAYVEVDFAGSRYDYRAVVWRRGEVTVGPLIERGSRNKGRSAAGTPVDRALRELGVRAGLAEDEWSTVGLGLWRSVRIPGLRLWGDHDTKPVGTVYTMVARVPGSGIEAFAAYEDAVLPLVADHGGRIERRLRSRDHADEVHLIWFPTAESFRSYRDDPRRTAFQHLLSESGASIELMELHDVDTIRLPLLGT